MRLSRRPPHSSLVVLLFAGALLPRQAGGAARVPEDGPFQLTILHVNDVESQIVDAGKGLERFGGSARLVTLVHQVRQESDAARGESPGATVFVSAGDSFEAGPSVAAWRSGGPFLDARALDLAGVEVLTLGNHEFDLGPQTTAGFISEFPKTTPFVSADIDVSRDPAMSALAKAGRLTPSVVLVRGGRRIGFVGVVTPLLPAISSPGPVKVARDPAASVQREIDALHAQGVGIIILLSHMQGVSEDQALLKRLRCVDLVVSGGGNDVLASPGDRLLPDDAEHVEGPYPAWGRDTEGRSVPIACTGGGSRYLGRFTGTFDGKGDLVSIDEDASGPVLVADESLPGGVVADARTLTEVVQPLVKLSEALAKTIVGTLQVPLDGRRATLRSAESNEADFVTDAMIWKAGELARAKGRPAPTVAMLNGGSIRHDSRLLRGQRLTGLDVLRVAPFDNELVVLPELRPSRLKDVLENAVSLVESADGRFLHVSGLKFTWDESRPAHRIDADGRVVEKGSRIRDVSLADGTVLIKDGEVVSDKPLAVVVTDFLQRGGDEHPLSDLPAVALGVNTQEAISEYLKDHLAGVVTAKAYPPGGLGRITRLR